MFSDYHVHTEFSDDSVYPMEQVVRDAIDRGMDEICFTDHVDYGIKQDWDCGKPMLYRGEEPLANVDYPVYIARLKELQEKYREKIRIKIGIEFGMQVHTIPLYRALFHKYPFDFVILSVHQVDDREFTLDTRELREILEGVPFSEPEVSQYIMEFLTENKSEVDQGVVL